MEGFPGLLSPFAGCSKSFARMRWDCREGVFNGLLPVLNPNGFMTGWWWVADDELLPPEGKHPGSRREREVSSQLLELSQQAVTVNSPILLSRWVMRNDRLGNVGIKFTCGLCQKPKMEHVCGASEVLSFCFVDLFFFYTDPKPFLWNFFLAVFSGLRRTMAVNHVCVLA